MIRILCSRALVALATTALTLGAQDIPVLDLTTSEGTAPIRLVGYGLVTGLSGTGDRVTGTFGSRHTVQSVVNLLRNFELQVPANLLRTRNVAAVLVTAEVSPYLRAGGRFDVQVSSVGDAQSLQGGVLWMTPLVPDVGAAPMAIAQGPMLVTDLGTSRSIVRGVTSGRVPDGGLLERTPPRPVVAESSRLFLRKPDLAMAFRIAEAINGALGSEVATVEDPGAVRLTPGEGAAALPGLMARIAEVRVRAQPVSRILVDARDGTVVAGADLVVGDGVVSVDGITLVIGGDSSVDATTMPSGTRVRDVAEALRAARASARQTADVFLALRDAGALHADVVIR